VTNIFTDTQRQDPAAPTGLTPRAAEQGGPDSGGGGAGLDFWLNLGVQLGDYLEQVKHDRFEQDRLPPSSEPIFTAGIVNDNGDPLILDLGTASQGRIWQVRRMIAGAPDVTQSVNGSAYWFRQGAAPTDYNITNCVNIFSDLPRGDTVGSQELYIPAAEHLFCVIVGGDIGQQYIASAFVEDWDFAVFTHSGH